jgi:hypothetical protein
MRYPGKVQDLPCIADLNQEVGEDRFQDGWVVAWLASSEYYSPAEFATAVAGATGAPAIALYVMDSDYAECRCVSPGGVDYEFYLDEATFLSYLEDYDPEDVADILAAAPRNPGAVAVLVDWATEARLHADVDKLHAALAERPGPFNDGVYQFLDAIGLRGG